MTRDNISLISYQQSRFLTGTSHGPTIVMQMDQQEPDERRSAYHRLNREFINLPASTTWYQSLPHFLTSAPEPSETAANRRYQAPAFKPGRLPMQTRSRRPNSASSSAQHQTPVTSFPGTPPASAITNTDWRPPTGSHLTPDSVPDPGCPPPWHPASFRLPTGTMANTGRPPPTGHRLTPDPVPDSGCPPPWHPTSCRLPAHTVASADRKSPTGSHLTSHSGSDLGRLPARHPADTRHPVSTITYTA